MIVLGPAAVIGIAGTVLMVFRGDAAGILLVATASLCLGQIVGFLWASNRREESRLQGGLTVAKAVIGGLAVSDLLRAGGVIRGTFVALSASIGTTMQPGVVGSLLFSFATIGFFHMFFSRAFIGLDRERKKSAPEMETPRRQATE